MDVTSPSLSIAQAATLAELPANYVHGMLRDRVFAFLAPVPAKGRAQRGALIDTWRLRCFKLMLGGGFSEFDALWVLNTELDTRVGALFAPGIPVDAAFLTARLDGAAVHVWLAGDGEPPEVFATPSDVPPPADVECAITLQLFPIWSGIVARLDATFASGRVTHLGHRRAAGDAAAREFPRTSLPKHDAGEAPAQELQSK